MNQTVLFENQFDKANCLHSFVNKLERLRPECALEVSSQEEANCIRQIIEFESVPGTVLPFQTLGLRGTCHTCGVAHALDSGRTKIAIREWLLRPTTQFSMGDLHKCLFDDCIAEQEMDAADAWDMRSLRPVIFEKLASMGVTAAQTQQLLQMLGQNGKLLLVSRALQLKRSRN